MREKITSKFKHLVLWRIQGLGAVSGASGLRRTVGRTDRDDGTDGLHARQKHRVHGIHVSSARAESPDYTNLHVEATHTTTYIAQYRNFFQNHSHLMFNGESHSMRYCLVSFERAILG